MPNLIVAFFVDPKIATFLNRPNLKLIIKSLVLRITVHLMELQEKDIRLFQSSLRKHSNYNFDDYSITSLRRRLTRILLEVDSNMEDLIAGMETDKETLAHIVGKLTVHTTELFRDPPIWKEIKKTLLPSWKGRSTINIWHPGCSTGQEVYSMLMVLESLDMLDKSRICASDLNPKVLDTARLGRYRYRFNQSYLENFDKVLLGGEGNILPEHEKAWKRYFSIDQKRDALQMHATLCAKPVYKKLDLVQDSNLFLSKFDLIVCRNVIIYFNNDLQNKVFDLFYNNMKPGGVLILGVHESILGPASRKFKKQGPFYTRIAE